MVTKNGHINWPQNFKTLNYGANFYQSDAKNFNKER